MLSTDFITQQIQDSIRAKQLLLSDTELLGRILDAAKLIIEAYQNGKKTLLAGNGGSAGDAQHIAGEFVNKFNFDRPGLPSLAITTDSSVLTAVANDYSFQQIFARQIQALGHPGDVFIALSTSGTSGNIIAALQMAKECGLKTIGLTGATGKEMEKWCDICLTVPASETPRVQEAHILLGHILCHLTEEGLFCNEPTR
jgi:D-sedoheptulose 7-phosphate isomerase